MKISIIWFFICYWEVARVAVDGARILAIFPAPVKSHFIFNEAVVRSLYDAGHQITFLSPFPDDESLRNYTLIDSRSDTVIYVNQWSLEYIRQMTVFKFSYLSGEAEEKFCCDVLGLKQIQEMMMNTNEATKFDVIFVELLSMHDCFLPLAEKHNIPVIGTVAYKSWKMADVAVGNPNHPAIIPGEFTKFSDRMSFAERVVNVLHSSYLHFRYAIQLPMKLKKIYEKFYSADVVNKKKISLLFVNSHFSILSRPGAPNVVEVAGVHVKALNALNQDFQTFLDEAEHGAVLFSLGSVVRSGSLSQSMKAAFRDAFAEIPQRVIWKYDESIDGLSDNVLLTKWMPQRDILAHKKVKAFITHGGIAGCIEAIVEAVPMIFTPLFADQLSNAALLQRHGVGVQLDLHSVTKEKILDALATVINDTKYGAAMRRLSDRFEDRPLSPQKSIVYWTEYVIRHHGAAHLRTIGADMPLYQYLLLDVSFFACAIIIAIFCIVLFVVRKFCLIIISLRGNSERCAAVEVDKKKL